MCQKCGKGLHGPCFNKYHGVEQWTLLVESDIRPV
jgi:hypothetical protein